MFEAAYLYYFACQTLLFCISLEDFMYDDLRSPEVDRKLADMFSQSRIEGWLADEIEFVLDGEENEGGDVVVRNVSVEGLGDSLVFDWSNKLRSAADSIYILFPTFNQRLLLFECYRVFLAKVLYEFQKLMKSPPLLESEFYPRHLQFSSQFDHLIKRSTDQTSMDIQGLVDNSTGNSLATILEQKIDPISMSWQLVVYIAAAAEKNTP